MAVFNMLLSSLFGSLPPSIPPSFPPFLPPSLPPSSLLLLVEKVAIKIIDKTKLDEHARRLLSREITCMERLDHSNVIRLFEVIDTFPRLHIVMECASEGDLHVKVVNDGPFNESNGRSIFIQVVSAINHMVRSTQQ